jgi:hypothetical protein
VIYEMRYICISSKFIRQIGMLELFCLLFDITVFSDIINNIPNPFFKESTKKQQKSIGNCPQNLLMPFIILEWFHVARYITLCLSNNWARPDNSYNCIYCSRILSED